MKSVFKKGSRKTRDWSARLKGRFKRSKVPHSTVNHASNDATHHYTYSDLWQDVKGFHRLWVFTDKLQDRNAVASMEPKSQDVFECFLYDIKPFIEEQKTHNPDKAVTHLTLMGDVSMYLFKVNPIYRETGSNRYLALTKCENMYINDSAPKAFPLLENLIPSPPPLTSKRSGRRISGQ